MSGKTFRPGATYYARSIGDHACIYTARVLSRTTKTVRVEIDRGDPVTRRIFIDYDGNEAFLPFGNYSMAAVIRAERVVFGGAK